MRIISTIPDKNTFPEKVLMQFSENTLFFDIETTGLSKKYHSIYMVGCMFLEKDQLVIRQYFSESLDDEKEVLSKFIEFANNFDTYISFNGDQFDIPFLSDKIHNYGFVSPFPDKTSIDLYKLAKKYKHLLKLPNLKQKTIETTLGCSRKDQYSGGELIQIYLDYIKRPSEDMFDLLVLHNYDDMLGMTYLLSLLSLEYLDSDSADISAQYSTYTDYEGNVLSQLLINGKLDINITCPISFAYSDYYLTLNPNGFHIAVTIYDNSIKIPYEDYKNYIYLPLEDIAIPKQLASGIPKAEQKKCTALNCYGRQKINESFVDNHALIRNYSKKILHLLLHVAK